VDIITTNSGPGNVFVYLPRGEAGILLGELVASHCPEGPATDGFGRPCPQGDWCAPGYRLVPMAQAWPGMMLARDEIVAVPG
jgi:hypothetical protein